MRINGPIKIPTDFISSRLESAIRAVESFRGLEQIGPFRFHRFAQFRRYPHLLGKMFLPMIGPRRVDDGAGCGEIALLDFFRFQTRIDARAPDAPVDIE
jgi:hypothetical protein